MTEEMPEQNADTIQNLRSAYLIYTNRSKTCLQLHQHTQIINTSLEGVTEEEPTCEVVYIQFAQIDEVIDMLERTKEMMEYG